MLMDYRVDGVVKSRKKRLHKKGAWNPFDSI